MWQSLALPRYKRQFYYLLHVSGSCCLALLHIREASNPARGFYEFYQVVLADDTTLPTSKLRLYYTFFFN
jgi:hypothetical protein